MVEEHELIFKNSYKLRTRTLRKTKDYINGYECVKMIYDYDIWGIAKVKIYKLTNIDRQLKHATYSRIKLMLCTATWI